MRHSLKAVVLSLMLVSAAAAQETVHRTPGLSVVPVTLNLGLTHERVFRQLKDAGYKAFEVSPPKGYSSHFLVVEQDTPELGAAAHSKGLLFFEGDSLVRISANLGWDFRTDRELAPSLLHHSKIRAKRPATTHVSCAQSMTRKAFRLA
jgi:hypothetical protein